MQMNIVGTSQKVDTAQTVTGSISWINIKNVSLKIETVLHIPMEFVLNANNSSIVIEDSVTQMLKDA